MTVPPTPAIPPGRIAHFVPRKQPSAFTAITRQKSASSQSTRSAAVSMPALFTTTSSRPQRPTVAASARSQSASSVDVAAHEAAVDPRRGRPSRVFQDVGDHHARAAPRQRPHHLGAESACAARDERHPPFQSVSGIHRHLLHEFIRSRRCRA